ncbi:MAG: restriction endonuclease subunit S [Oscillospiraceae bacterium]|nr:restriction endonuclease subunit S [Oscillospiraceae bacterium]
MMARLGDVGKVITGNTPKTSDMQNYASKDICFVKPSDIFDGTVSYLDNSEFYISEYARTKVRVLPPKSVLVTCIGIIGKVAINNVECAFNQQINAIIPDKNKCLTEYLAYAIQNKQEEMQDIANAPVVPILNKTQFSNIDINLPSLNEQTEIVEKLNAVSELIALRKEQLAKLDQLVKSRFIEMFGKETEFDKWPCCTIGDVADVCVGVVIKPTQYYTDKGIPAFRSLNIGEMRVKDSDWVYFTEEGHQNNQKSVVHKNDVLVVRSGAPGTACVATEKYDGYNAVDIIIAHPDNSKVNSIFLAAFTNMPHGMNQIRERTGGAAQQHFNVGGYKAMRLILPSIESQNQFAAFVEQTDKSKFDLKQSLDKLELLKKSLMQEYFG